MRLIDSQADQNQVFLAEATNKVIGFVEVSLRDVAEGAWTSPVGYLEAWYVEPEFRKQGIGRKLFTAAERLDPYERLFSNGIRH